MEEPTLSSQRETTFQACPTKPRRFGGWKAVLLLSLAAVCALALVFIFLPKATIPPQTSEQETHRPSRRSPQEQALLRDIVQEMIAEGKLTPYPPGSPEAQRAKPATPITPAERTELYERYVLDLLN